MGDGPLQTDRLSPVTQAINQRLPGGITPAELRELKQMAASGAVALVDINNTIAEATDNPNLSDAQRREVLGALDQMRSVAAKAAGAQADALTKTLAWIDTLNPFAYVRALLGGARVGSGHTW